MAETTNPTTTVEVNITSKTSLKNDKRAKPKASHPTTAVMVTTAIHSLKERGGSSLQAIKKYIAATYKVDVEKFAPFIKKFIKASVISGGLLQTKGKGASGSFKLSGSAGNRSTNAVAPKAKKPAAKKPVAKKAVATKKAKVAKPAATPKKVVAKKSPAKFKAAAKKPIVVKVAKPKSTPKVKVTKSAIKKAKSPKPKSTKAKGKVVKKTSPRKK